MSFTNSEQLYGVLSKVVSGGGVIGVQDGAGVLFSVTTAVASGFTAPSSMSGATFFAFNARSGVTKPDTSGGGWLYYFNAGAHSGIGAGTGGVAVLPPDQWSPQPFTSGLCVGISGNAALALTVTYRAGI